MKNIIKIAVFGAGLVALLSIMSVVFNGGYLASKGCVIYYDRRIAELNNAPEGQIEVLCVGDSLCGAGFCSPSLYRDYGITSYNMGKEMQKSVETYYCIKKAIKKQPIKVVLWETHNLLKKYEPADALGYRLGENLRYRFPFIKYHTFWKFFTDGRSIRKYFGGFIVDETVVPYEGAVPYYDPETKQHFDMHGEQEYMLTKVQKLCEENGIKLVLVSFLSPVCYQYELHACLDKEARERGLEYLDINAVQDQLGVDWANDFYDAGDHVNLFGAERMTAYIGEYLKKECGLTDHRGDPEYQPWDNMLAGYEQDVIDMEGTDYFIKEDDAGIQRQILVLRKLDHDKYEKNDE